MYQAEALAITKACEQVAERAEVTRLPKSVTIYSDSQAVLKALGSRWIKSKVVKRCADALNSLGESFSVQLCWVKGHSGVLGNEEADRLAREAAEGGWGDSDPVTVPRSSAYYRQEFKMHLYDRWVQRWRETPIAFGRQTKVWFPEPSFRKTRKLLSLERPLFSAVVRWLTGHAFLGLQNFRCGSVAVSYCRLCGEVPERADHLLLRCPGLCQLRAECFKAWNLDHPPRWEVDWITNFLRDGRVEHLEDPTNSPEDISGRTESGDESGEDTSSDSDGY